MTFRDELAEATRDIRRQIHEMPFNRELADGTLPAEIFRGYVIQDAHYLVGFGRALALAAARAPDAETLMQLAGSAVGAVAVERQLHARYMELFGVSAAQFEAAEVSQVCDHYVSFLLRATALESFEEGVAALLPCFWIYLDVGKEIARSSGPDNPYKAWIDTYSGEEFGEGVARMLALTDRVAETASAGTRAGMHRAFARSCWHEWRFWDSAYRRQGWPAPGGLYSVSLFT